MMFNETWAYVFRPVIVAWTNYVCVYVWCKSLGLIIMKWVLILLTAYQIIVCVVDINYNYIKKTNYCSTSHYINTLSIIFSKKPLCPFNTKILAHYAVPERQKMNINLLVRAVLVKKTTTKTATMMTPHIFFSFDTRKNLHINKEIRVLGWCRSSFLYSCSLVLQK